MSQLFFNQFKKNCPITNQELYCPPIVQKAGGKKKENFTGLIFFSGNCSNSGHVQCPGSFKCIPKSYLCDGDNDCRDNARSDEQGCR